MADQTRVAPHLRPFGTTIFSEMSALAARHDAVNLGQGFPDFDAPEALKVAAQKAIADGFNQYAGGAGLYRLRRAVADHMQAHHSLAVDPDTEVTITTGATEGVYAALAGLCQPGDEVVLIEPWYDSYRASCAMVGATVIGVPLQEDPTGGWRLDPDDIARAVGPKTRAIVVNTPHNPLGKVFDRVELTAIVQAAASVDAVVIADEVYEHLTFGAPHLSVLHIDGARECTIRISSAAKTFSVTGWKVGWACAPPDLTDAVRAAKQWTTFTSGTPFQVAVADALGWGQEYFGPWRTAYEARRDLLCEGLQKAGFQVTAPDGTFFIAADIRSSGFDDDLAFCRRLPAELGVGAIPISVFHADPDAARGLVRFAFCKTEDALHEGIQRMVEGLPGMARP